MSFITFFLFLFQFKYKLKEKHESLMWLNVCVGVFVKMYASCVLKESEMAQARTHCDKSNS